MFVYNCIPVDTIIEGAIKLVFVASLLSMQDLGERTKTGWLGIRTMCPRGLTCLSADCCFSDLAQ